MKGSELIKKAIESDMPDMEAVQKKCIEELHQGKKASEKMNKKKPKQKIRKSIYATLGACAAIWFCVLNLPVSSDAESFIARLQTWLHLKSERVEVGKMEKNSIRIPEDCEEVEYEGEKYLAKSYTSPEELEEDIGKHLEIWRGVDEFEEDGIVLRMVDGEYARVDLFYDVLEGEVLESAGHGEEIQLLECYITMPLSAEFSMNNIKLQDQVLKDATLDGKGNLISYGQNGDYSILETYYSEHLDTDVSVIGKRMTDMGREQDNVINYYYLYFVYEGLSYQINCHSNLETAKSIVEALE